MAYNIPLEKGGYVGGDVDEGWTFVSVATYTENVANFKLNYNYGTRFCALLGERFMGAAREWWINHQNADGSKPNCWRAAAQGNKPPDVIEVPFRDIIMDQFSNPLDRELAMTELDQLRWNPANEHLKSLRTPITSLFNRAHIQEWSMRRPYVLKVFDDDMRRAVRFPPTEEQLWAEAQLQ